LTVPARDLIVLADLMGEGGEHDAYPAAYLRRAAARIASLLAERGRSVPYPARRTSKWSGFTQRRFPQRRTSTAPAGSGPRTSS
jgi:hypothetical protein